MKEFLPISREETIKKVAEYFNTHGLENISEPFDYKEVVNLFNYYYNLWENDKLTFENPDAEEKFLNAVCISRIFAYGEISEDVRKYGDTILERELKKLKDFKIKEIK